MTILSIHQLSIQIGSKLICKDLHCTIKSGEKWAILGPNGIGKTTLLHTFAGLNYPSAGKILLHNKDLKRWKVKARAAEIGILCQENETTFPQTIEEYVSQALFPHQKTKASIQQKKIKYLLSQMAFPNPHLSVLHLSVGEKKRLAIVSLLIQDPQLFLLDEPTNHLDIFYQFKMLDLFADLSSQLNKTFMMATHDIQLASLYCGHMILLFPDGSHLIGKTKEIYTLSNLSRLYQLEEKIIKEYLKKKGMQNVD